MTGVWASLCFPSSLFGSRARAIPECRTRLPAWHASERTMTGTSKSGAGPPPNDISLPGSVAAGRRGSAAAEIYRNAERGVHAVSFSENPEALGFSNIYDRLDPGHVRKLRQ